MGLALLSGPRGIYRPIKRPRCSPFNERHPSPKERLEISTAVAYCPLAATGSFCLGLITGSVSPGNYISLRVTGTGRSYARAFRFCATVPRCQLLPASLGSHRRPLGWVM